ncbi:hypothetical protein NLI96_g4213 [Meripilus lineatus]|uniref:Uncharacterized protein n=1 Tax=Meripilus lineatus TaxID=2056292 RepID=A0AAD5YFW9_9APHY|nr:hypothetical protein NLI96_g4213 [Physisporinus lineatus]
MKSPSIRVPPPVEMPPDIHPLPDSVTPYFVYPFTLEPHVLTVESSRKSTLAAHAARREAYLKAREDEKERRKREALHRIAPGFEPQSAPLIPTTRAPLDGSVALSISGASQVTKEDLNQRSRSVMDDLVDQLAALDSRSSSS